VAATAALAAAGLSSAIAAVTTGGAASGVTVAAGRFDSSTTRSPGASAATATLRGARLRLGFSAGAASLGSAGAAATFSGVRGSA
jgi:hypothetical protein